MSLLFLLIHTKHNLFDTHVPINKMSLFSVFSEQFRTYLCLGEL